MRGRDFIGFGAPFGAFCGSEFLVELVIGSRPFFPADPVGQFFVCLIAGDFGDTDAILFTGSDSDGNAVFDIEDGVGGYAGFDEPSE